MPPDDYRDGWDELVAFALQSFGVPKEAVARPGLYASLLLAGPPFHWSPGQMGFHRRAALARIKDGKVGPT